MKNKTDSYWGVDTFDVTDGKATLLDRNTRIEGEVLLEKREDHDNDWNADIRLTIFATKEGIGFDYEYPAGYSEYTYDPDTMRKFYITHDVDWFFRLGLDADQRNMVTSYDADDVKLALETYLKG
jgi:hypothetical protein